ncbi:MAG TPA: hypothetical protein VEK33_04445 [Terriglobales bacterium]|nr:hypothetical protein [Terriglobales bacterium]
MEKIPTAPSPVANWRELYQAALFETDRQRLSRRIALAEQALIARGRELFFNADAHVAEQQAIENALNALHALEICLGLERSRAV